MAPCVCLCKVLYCFHRSRQQGCTLPQSQRSKQLVVTRFRTRFQLFGVLSAPTRPGCIVWYSVQCTVYSVQCTVYSVQCTVYSVQCTVYSVQCTVYSVQCTVYSVQCTVYSVQCTVYSVQCTVYSVQCTVYSVQCTVYSVQCTVYSVQCTVYSVQCTVYSVQCTVYSVQCTVPFRVNFSLVNNLAISAIWTLPLPLTGFGSKNANAIFKFPPTPKTNKKRVSPILVEPTRDLRENHGES